MKEYEVTCVTLAAPGTGHEHITHIGNNRRQWRLELESAVSRIDYQLELFYITDRATGDRAYLRIVREEGKPPYLRARCGDQWNDGLLALPACDEHCVLL